MAGIVDREYEGFRKIFRDLRLHVDVGLKLYQARRNESDARFHDLFQMLDSLLGPAQKHQQTLAQSAHQYVRYKAIMQLSNFVCTSYEITSLLSYTSLHQYTYILLYCYDVASVCIIN